MHTRNIHTHIYTRMNFQEHFDRDTEDMRARVITKLSLIFCFLVYFFQHTSVRYKKADKMTERKSSRKTLTPKRFIPEETEKKDKDVSGGQKSGGSKVRLIS